MSSERRSVLVVDDSPLMLRFVRELIDGFDGFRVVGTARDGEEAARLVHELNPDIVTLDIEMPGVDGLAALGYIMSEAPRPVIMLSAATTRGTVDLTIRALELGAVDFVRKPVGEPDTGWERVSRRLHDALVAAARSNLSGAPMLARPRLRTPTPPSDLRTPARVAVAIASSTGGPRALAEIVPGLPASLGAAVLIAQHMPPGFTLGLGRRLDQLSALPVHEATTGEPLYHGHVYIAPGGRHLTLARTAEGVETVLGDGPPVHGVRPAADQLFESVARVFGAQSVGVVLTGMGRDGSAGLSAIRRVGGASLVQDRATSAVYGMPAHALGTAGADAEVPLSGVAAAVVAAVARIGTRVG